MPDRESERWLRYTGFHHFLAEDFLLLPASPCAALFGGRLNVLRCAVPYCAVLRCTGHIHKSWARAAV